MINLALITRTSTAAPARFFQRWVDHDTWPAWDTDAQWVRMDGPVQVGARGTLKPRRGPRVRFRVTECEPDRVYTDVSTLPGTRLTFRHSAAPLGTGSRLGVQVYLDGPLSGLWARTAFRDFETSVTEALDRLIAMVEAS